MDFKKIRKELLKMNDSDFISEFEISPKELEEYDRTNEVPLVIIRKIAKNANVSVKEILNYEGVKVEKQEEAKRPSYEIRVDLFEYLENSPLKDTFLSWLKLNEKKLNLSDASKEWVDDCITWYFEEFDKRIADKDEDNLITHEDIVSRFDFLNNITQNDKKKLEYIRDNKAKCKEIVKEVVNYETTRLLEMDTIIEKYNDKTREERDKAFKNYLFYLDEFFTVDSIRKLWDEFVEKVDLNDKDANFYSYVVDILNEKQQILVFCEVIDDIARGENGILEYFEKETKKAFEKATELNCFSVEDNYRLFYTRGLLHPENFDIERTEYTDEDYSKMDKNASKRRRKEGVGRFFKYYFLPPTIIIDIVNSKKNSAKDILKGMNDYKYRERSEEEAFCSYTEVICAFQFAAYCIKDEWKDYLDNLMDLIEMDAENIQELIAEEDKKLFIMKRLTDAFRVEEK